MTDNFTERMTAYEARMESKTKDMDEWHRRRYSGIGGSEVSVVLGMNDYKTRHQLWEEKTGRTEPFTGNKFTHWGTILEESVADEYARITGEKIRKTSKHFRHKDYPWLVGNLDRVIVKNDRHPTKILECKTCTDDSKTDSDGEKDWGPGNIYGPDKQILGTDDCVPASYMLQVQHYMLITGYSQVDLAVLFMRTRDFRIYTINRNETLIDTIIQETRKFWDCVLDDVEPEMTDAEKAEKFAKSCNGESLECSPEIWPEVNTYLFLKERLTELTADAKTVATKIKAFMGEHKFLTNGGKKVLTLTAPSMTRTFSKDLLKQKYPAIYEECQEDTMTTRQLRIAK